MKIGELLVELGFKADQTKLKDFIKSVGDLNMSSVMATMGIGGMYDAVRKIMGAAEATAMGISSFGLETGLSTKKMQQWSAYAEGMGTSADEASRSLRTIQGHLTGLKLGTDASLLTPFAMLNRIGAGISGQEDPFTLLEKVGKVINKLAPDMRRLVVEQMGLSDSMIPVLEGLSSGAWKDMPFSDPKDVESLMEYHKELSSLGADWKRMMTELGGQMVPAVEGWLGIGKAILEAAHANQFLIPSMTALIALVAVMTGLIAPWAAILGAVAVAVGLIAKNWAWINESISGAREKILGMPIFSGLNKAADWIDRVLPDSAMPGHEGSRTSNVTNHFKVYSNDPEEAARKVAETLRRMHNDVEGQSPRESN